MEKFEVLNCLKDTLSVLSGIKKDKVVSNLCGIVEYFANPDITRQIFPEAIKLYTEICEELYKKDEFVSLSNYVYNLILYNENVFSTTCAKNMTEYLSAHVYDAFKQDVKTLRLLSSIGYEEMISELILNNPDLEDIKDSIPTYSNKIKLNKDKEIWEDNINDFVKFYSKNGTGMYAKYYAYMVNGEGDIVPVKFPDKVKLSDLKLYETQKQKANENVFSFISGDKYNNVLLYGDRGTGKSSCVKALANEYADMGLRIIQIDKDKLKFLSGILSKLADNPLKFIIFIDDLTFDESDKEINSLKAVLEGSLTYQPKNVVIYTTSNRKHLVKETFSAREGDDIHRQDTIDELMSLSDRFGLIITYQRPSKDIYLEIVNILARERGIEDSFESLSEKAERFALEKGFRSPRIAKQFLDFTYKQI